MGFKLLWLNLFSYPSRILSISTFLHLPNTEGQIILMTCHLPAGNDVHFQLLISPLSLSNSLDCHQTQAEVGGRTQPGQLCHLKIRACSAEFCLLPQSNPDGRLGTSLGSGRRLVVNLISCREMAGLKEDLAS